jgi:hypothetical protein
MKRKFTRRELGIAVAGAGAVAVNAQPPAAGNDQAIERSARERNTRNAETLAKFEIPISTEPAFQFKA